MENKKERKFKEEIFWKNWYSFPPKKDYILDHCYLLANREREKEARTHGFFIV